MSASKDYAAAADAYAFEQLTVPVGAVALTAATYAPVGQPRGPDEARILCDTQPVRLRFDGGTPTAGAGHLLAVGQEFVIRGVANIVRARLIRATGADGAVSVTYGRFIK